MIANQVYFFGSTIYDMHEKLKGLDYEVFKRSITDVDLSNRSVVILENEKLRG